MKRLHCEVIINRGVINMLVDMGRIKWPQRADPLAISGAISGLLDDWARSGKTLKQFIKDEKVQHADSE